MTMQRFSIEEVHIAAKVLRLAGAERAAVGGVLLLGLASAVLESAGLSLFAPLVQYATGSEAPTVPVVRWLMPSVGASPVGMIALIVGFLFLGIVVGYVNGVLSNHLAMRLAHRLRVQVFETALTRPLGAMESLPPGKFVNNLATETWRVCDALLVVINLMVQTLTCLVFLGLLLLLSPSYTAILAIMAFAMAALVHFATRGVRQLGASAVAANEAFMSYFWDALGGLRVIRGFGREPHERGRFEERSERIVRVFVRQQVVAGLVGPITQMMTIGTIGVILGLALLRGDDLGTLVSFLAIAYRLQPRIAATLSARTNLRSLAASVDEIEAALAGTDETGAGPGRTFDRLRRGVVLDNVSVRYPLGERPALHGVSVAFPIGAVTAVAGYSGAGKSTLVSLLLRFIAPDSGRILIDGVPLDDIDPAQWHRRIAFVEQNAFLFNATVRDNIGYGDLEADDDAIRTAARIAQADDFIATLPDGYDTMIGEHRYRLSQGQRQRIALARSLLRRPDVLILDEATNALDRPTDIALRAAIESGRAERTVIVIAHRRETIETADHVIVLDGGRAVECGTPADLAVLGGIFARLYRDEAHSREVG
jgi:subfamily B ATP-binding cassette protein MsbA